MKHIIREYAGKEIKLFRNVSLLTIENLLLRPFMVSSLYYDITKWFKITRKSLSETLIFASTHPQYDDRFLPVQVLIHIFFAK